MIDLLHPVALGVAVLCVPVATVAVSGAIDLISHRQHHRAGIALELVSAPAIAADESTASSGVESK